MGRKELKELQGDEFSESYRMKWNMKNVNWPQEINRFLAITIIRLWNCISQEVVETFTAQLDKVLSGARWHAISFHIIYEFFFLDLLEAQIGFILPKDFSQAPLYPSYSLLQLYLMPRVLIGPRCHIVWNLENKMYLRSIIYKIIHIIHKNNKLDSIMILNTSNLHITS